MIIDPELIDYLLGEGGPVIRWRTATELIPEDGNHNRAEMLTALLDCPEVKHWISLLGSGPIHHSKDSAAENVLGKLCEYGLHAGMPALDERALPYCGIDQGKYHQDEALIIMPFLVRAGYADEPSVSDWVEQRIGTLATLATSVDYDFYMHEHERMRLPPAQRLLRGSPKLFYQSRFNHHWSVIGIPTCYDLYALAYLPKVDPLANQKVEMIVSYLLNPAFQDTPGGYIWNAQLHRPYAAGRVFLACLPLETERQKLVLFMEILAQFESGRQSNWFKQGMLLLESYRTERGTYRFPREFLGEKHNYYLYAGGHMGLGEEPRNSRAMELESTFRMLRLKKIVSA